MFGINAKTSVDSILENNPTWVVYIRVDRRFPCKTCFSDRKGSTQYECDDCLGIGYVISKERLPVRLYVRRPENKRNNDTRIGIEEEFGTRAIFRAEDYPQIDDLIIEVEWNVPYTKVETMGQVAKVIRIHEINNVFTEYDAGKVVYHRTGLEAASVETKMFQKILQSRGID